MRIIISSNHPLKLISWHTDQVPQVRHIPEQKWYPPNYDVCFQLAQLRLWHVAPDRLKGHCCVWIWTNLMNITSLHAMPFKYGNLHTNCTKRMSCLCKFLGADHNNEILKHEVGGDPPLIYQPEFYLDGGRVQSRLFNSSSATVLWQHWMWDQPWCPYLQVQEVQLLR